MATKYGAGSISKLDNGKWKWRGHFVDPTTGKSCRPSKTFDTKAEAEAYKKQVFKQGLERTTNSTLTVSEAYKRWQDEVWKVTGNLSSNTVRGYLGVFNKHWIPLIGNNKLDNIKSDKIQKYYNKLKHDGLTQKTIRNINSALKSLFDYCLKRKWMSSSPLDAVVIPKDTMKKRASYKKHLMDKMLTEAEYAMINDHFNGIYQYALAFMADSGIRPEEIAITWDNVDFDKREIKITTSVKREIIDYDTRQSIRVESDELKNPNAYRTLPMTWSMLLILRAQQDMLEELNIKSKYVFPTSNGNIIELRNLLRSFHIACKKAGIEPRTLLVLRKLYITRRIREGMDPKTLQYLVGHESITTTLAFYQMLDLDEVKNEAKDIDTRLIFKPTN